MSQQTSEQNKESVLYTLIANLAASKLIYNAQISSSLLTQYRELEYKVEQELDACLNEYIPATIALPEKMRVISLKATVVLRRLLRGQDEDYHIKFFKLLLKSYPRFVSDIKLLCEKSEEGLSISDFEAESDFYCYDYSLHDIAVLVLMSSELFERKYQVEVKGLNKYFIKQIRILTTDYMRNPNPTAVNTTMSSISFSMKKKTMPEYFDEWSEYYRGENSDFSSGIYADPFSAFRIMSVGSGLVPEDVFNPALITQSTNIDAAFAAIMSLRQKKEETDTCLDIKSATNSRTEQHLIELFLFNLMLRVMCDKYVNEVKASIRKELYGSNNKIASGVTTDDRERYKKLQKENDRLMGELRQVNRKLRETADIQLSSQKREGVLRDKLEALRLENIQLRELHPKEKTESTAPAPITVPIDLHVEGGEMEIDTVDLTEWLNQAFENKKIVFVGGNENLMKKIRTKYPKSIIIEKSRIASCDGTVRNADVVMFKTDSVSHSLYAKCKQLAVNSGVPIAYIDDVASVELMEKQIKEKLDILWNTREKGD